MQTTKEQLAKLEREVLIRKYLPSYSGETTVNVYFGDKVSIKQTTSKGDQYSRRCTYRKTDNRVDVNLRKLPPKQYLDIDGVLTLDISGKKRINGIVVLSASWLALKGKSPYLATGWIAVGEHCNYHSLVSPADAYRGSYHKKLKQYATTKAVELVDTLQNGPIPLEWADMPITYQDSINAGNCPSGTANFRSRLPNPNKATIRDVLSLAERLGGSIFALRACAFAIARQV